MAIINVVANVIVPVFGVLGVGYAVAWREWFNVDATRGLAFYTMRVAIPAMLFRAMSITDLPAYFPYRFVACYFLAAGFMFLLGTLLSKRLFYLPPAERALFAFGCSYSNLVLVGIPLVLTAWGDDAVLPLFTIVAFNTVILFTPLTMMLEADRHHRLPLIKQIGAALLGLIRNQYIASILAGLAVNLLGLPWPVALESILKMIAASATPCALFCMGATLARQRIAGEIRAASLISLVKLILFPASVWLLGHYLLGIDNDWLVVAVTIAAMPTGINIYLFAEQYQKGIALATTTTVLSTLFAVATVTVALTLLGAG